MDVSKVDVSMDGIELQDEDSFLRFRKAENQTPASRRFCPRGVCLVVRKKPEIMGMTPRDGHWEPNAT